MPKRYKQAVRTNRARATYDAGRGRAIDILDRPSPTITVGTAGSAPNANHFTVVDPMTVADPDETAATEEPLEPEIARSAGVELAPDAPPAAKLMDYRVVRSKRRPEFLPRGRVVVPIDWLVPNADNPKVIHAERFQNLMESVRRYPLFLLKREILVSDGPINRLAGFVYGGNQRIAVLQALYATGWDSGLWPIGYAPVDVDDIAREVAEAFLFIDNNQWGDWDERAVAETLRRLQDAGQDITVLGFEDTTAILRRLEADTAPDAFRELDESTVTVNTTCPRCGYEWQHTSSTKAADGA